MKVRDNTNAMNGNEKRLQLNCHQSTSDKETMGSEWTSIDSFKVLHQKQSILFPI